MSSIDIMKVPSPLQWNTKYEACPESKDTSRVGR